MKLPDNDNGSSRKAEAGGDGKRGESSSRTTDATNKTQRPASTRTPATVAPSSRLWLGLKDPRIVRVSRALGGKDRHSKVSTVRGLRDRRVRLSVQTAIQLYDLQDRLGLSQPSKVVDWLLDAAKHEIDKLPPLHFPPHFLHVGRVVPSTATTSGGLGYADRTLQAGAQQAAASRRAGHGWASTYWGSNNLIDGQDGDHRQRPGDEAQDDNGRGVGQQSNSAISYYHLVADQSNSGVATTSTGAVPPLAVGCYALQPTLPLDDLNCQYYGYRPASPLSLLPAPGGGNSQTSATALVFCPSGAMQAPSVFQAGHTSSFDPKLLGHFHSVASTTNSSLAPP